MRRPRRSSYGPRLAPRRAAPDDRRHPISGAVFDFVSTSSTTRGALLERGSGPYFYLPKMESHKEARLWNQIFDWTERELDLGSGTIRRRCLSSPTARFRDEETLYELRDHSGGLNAGRWTTCSASSRS